MTITPTRDRLVQANGVEICVETFGPADAPAILLLAGASTSMLYWHEELCERLATGPRFVIRFDYRDTGRSVTVDAGAPQYAADDLLADAIGLLDVLGIRRAHLLGLSLGGILAQAAAIDHPERVASLTLVATSPGGAGGQSGLPSMPDEIAAEFAAIPEPDWSDAASVVENLVEQERLCAARSRPFEVAEMRETLTRAVARSHDARAASNHFMIDPTTSGRARLGEITAPTLVLHGDEDPVFPPPHGVALAAAIPGARLVTLSQVGHELPRPAWEVAVPEILELTEYRSSPDSEAHPRD